MMSILVTGGAGFAGSHIVESLVNRGDEVIVYGSISNPSNLKSVEGRAKVEAGDILDRQRLFDVAKAHRVEKIVHTSAIGWRGTSVQEPVKTAEVNVIGSLNVYEVAKALGVKRVIGFSTIWVYGKTIKEPIDEDHPCNPTIPYAITKLAAEEMGLYYHQTYGVDFIAVRPSAIYGPRLRSGYAPILMLENAINGVPTKWPTGSEHRSDFVNVKDVSSAILLALDVDSAKLKHRIFNVSSGKAYTLKEVRDIIKSLIPEAEIELGSGVVEDWNQATGPISTVRAREELGYEPRYDLQEGFQEIIEWHKKGGT